MHADRVLEQNPALGCLFYYVAVLAFKMMFMTVLTAVQRVRNKAFVSQEDAVYLAGPAGKVNWSHPTVERTRKCHRNDMENVYLFCIVGFAYAWTQPDLALANSLFFFFTLSRVVHTVVYALVVVPQPARGISWLVGFAITGYMAARTLLYFA